MKLLHEKYMNFHKTNLIHENSAAALYSVNKKCVKLELLFTRKSPSPSAILDGFCSCLSWTTLSSALSITAVPLRLLLSSSQPDKFHVQQLSPWFQAVRRVSLVYITVPVLVPPHCNLKVGPPISIDIIFCLQDDSDIAQC